VLGTIVVEGVGVVDGMVEVISKFVTKNETLIRCNILPRKCTVQKDVLEADVKSGLKVFKDEGLILSEDM
jgi:hypothetical protein